MQDGLVDKKRLIELGSSTAKGGFRNEIDIARKFDNWKNDKDAQEWLRIMGYNLNEIKDVVAERKPVGIKTDVSVSIVLFLKDSVSEENLSVKLVSNSRGYNQMDKRSVDSYKSMWNIPDGITTALKLFTGEKKPNVKRTRDRRRMFLDELPKEMQQKIVKFFIDHKEMVISDILRWRDESAPHWILVALKTNGKQEWVLRNMDQAMYIFGAGPVEITNQGSLRIGRITMQRKGGTPDPTKLQFKANPVDLFDKKR